MPNGMTLLESVARSMAKPTTYRKASRVGMGPSRGAVQAQLEGVMNRRDNRLAGYQNAIDDAIDDAESQMKIEYENAWNDYLDSRSDVESPRFDADSWDEPYEVPSDDFVFSEWGHSGDMRDLSRQRDRLMGRHMASDEYELYPRQAQVRTPNYNRWQQDLANRSYNQQLGYDIARWNAALKGYNGGDIGAAMQSLLNQGYSRDQVLQMLRGLPQ